MNRSGLVIASLMVSLLAASCAPMGAPHPQGRTSQESGQPPTEGVSDELVALQAENAALKARLARLEPPSPQWITSNDLYDNHALTILDRDYLSKVIRDGKKVPFATIEHDESWIPPQYVPEWHSTSQTAVSIPSLIVANRRRFHILLASDGSGSSALQSLLGLQSRPGWVRPEPLPCGRMPEFPCYHLGEAVGSWRVYAIASKITEIRQEQDLIVFVVGLNLRGYQVIWIDSAGFRSDSNPMHFWAAFTTRDGAVLDAFQY